MTNCPNCKSKLGCSCNLRKASNGASCCAKCIAAYENKFKNNSNSVGSITEVTASPNLK